jgi:hypothetical protein
VAQTVVQVVAQAAKPACIFRRPVFFVAKAGLADAIRPDGRAGRSGRKWFNLSRLPALPSERIAHEEGKLPSKSLPRAGVPDGGLHFSLTFHSFAGFVFR